MKKVIAIVIGLFASVSVFAETVKIVKDDYMLFYDNNKNIKVENVANGLRGAGINNFRGDTKAATKAYWTAIHRMNDDLGEYLDSVTVLTDPSETALLTALITMLTYKGVSMDHIRRINEAVIVGDYTSYIDDNLACMINEVNYYYCNNPSDKHSCLFEGCVDKAQRFIVIALFAE